MSGRERETDTVKKGEKRSKSPGVPASGLSDGRATHQQFDEQTPVHSVPSEPQTARTPRVPVVSHAIQKHLDDLRDAARAVKRYALSKETVRDLKCRAIRHRFRPEVAERLIKHL